MQGEFRQKEAPLVIGVDDWHRGAIGLDSMQNLWHASAAALRHVQFLEELADAPVAIASAQEAKRLQIRVADRTVGAGETANGQAVGKNADFDWLADVIGPVVDGVAQAFLDGFHRVAEAAGGFGPIGMFDDFLHDYRGSDVAQCLAQDAVERSLENGFGKGIGAGAVGEVHHIDLGLGEETLRVLVEEHQSHVLGANKLVRAIHDVHAPAEVQEVHPGGLAEEGTADPLQIGADQAEIQIVEGGLVVHAVVKGYRRGQADQLRFVVRPGAHGGRALADVVSIFPALPGQIDGCFVRSRLPAASPEHENLPTLHLKRRHDWMVVWYEPVSQSQYLLLNPVDLRWIDSGGRQHRASIVFLHTDQDVAAAPVVEVVGKGAERMQDGQGVPALLELEPLRLDRTGVEQVIDVYRQIHAHRQLPSSSS